MTSLRERLEQKQRKRLVVPVQVSDPSREHEAYMGAASALQLARAKEETTPEYLTELEKQVIAAGERYRSHFVEVELQSLDRGDWHAAMSKWMGEDTIDWSAALAPLLAESCTDEALRDEQWWTDRLAGAEWTEGDVDALKAAVLALNVTSMEARYPKD